MSDEPVIDLGRIRALADAFDASDWDEVHLVVDGVEVHLSALPQGGPAGTGVGSEGVSGSAGRSEGVPRSSTAPAPAPNEGVPGSAERSQGVRRSTTAPAPDADHSTDEPATHPAKVPAGAGGTPVAAPSPGIFWRAPSPGAPPFVEVGDRVEADTVVGIVELMKLMNRVAAGVAGTVTAVLVANGESVEKSAPLVLVDPDG